MDREERTYKTPKLSPEELAEWREDCRKLKIMSKLKQYLSYHEFSPNKWDPLLKGETKPERLRIKDSEWQEAKDFARLFKQREDEETYEDDFEDASSSSPSSSSTSCQSTSSMEYGALRCTSPFSAAAQPDHPSISLNRESKVKLPKTFNIKFGLVHVKDFYVSKRERRMKSDAFPPEMVRKNHEEARIESMLDQIKMDDTADLDRFVFMHIKFNTVLALERGERGGDYASKPEREKVKVPTYAEFLKKSLSGIQDKYGDTDNGETRTHGHTSEPVSDSKTDACKNTVKMDKALFTAKETLPSVLVQEVTEAISTNLADRDETITADQATVSGEKGISNTTRAEPSASQSSTDNENQEMINEEIIAKLKENDNRRNLQLRENSYSLDGFTMPSNLKHKRVKQQPRLIGSAPLTRLNTVSESIKTRVKQPPVAASPISGVVRHTYHPISESLPSPEVTPKPNHARDFFDLEKMRSHSSQHRMNIECHRVRKISPIKEIPSAGESKPTPRGGCRVIYVKSAPGTELEDSGEKELDETNEKHDDTNEGLRKTDGSAENGVPSALSKDYVETSTAQTQRSNTSRPKWRRRIAEGMRRKLRRFGDRLKVFNCARCF